MSQINPTGGTTPTVETNVDDIETLLTLASSTGEADIDISEDDYTSYVNLMEIAPAASAPIIDAWVVFDLDKATNGFAGQHTTETVPDRDWETYEV